jgi:hypothetical protein
MTGRPKRERWLHDVEARQHNVVFPDTVQNEARFWRNLGKQGWTATIAIGLFVLGVLVFGRIAMFLIMLFRGGRIWTPALVGMFLFWGLLFGGIAWATRRTLRRIQDVRRSKGHKF